MSARTLSVYKLRPPFAWFGRVAQAAARPFAAFPWQRYILCAGPAQALAESVVVGSGLLFLVGFVWNAPPAILIACYFYSFISLVFPLMCAFRLRLSSGLWWQRLFYDSIVPGFALLILNANLHLILAISLSPSAEIEPLNLMITISNVYAACFFILARLTVRMWVELERLRRKHLRWGLTRAYTIGLVIITVVTAVPASIGNEFTHWLALALVKPGVPVPVAVLVMLIFEMCNCICAALLNLAIIFPPYAYVSYIVARRVTRRLEGLAQLSSALGAGAYTVRVTVEGEDEVAQLQTDFNAMSVALECSHKALQAERDRVTELLKVRRELVTSVSHELRTPISTLRGYLESALARWEDTPPPTLRHDLTVIEAEVTRLQALVDDLFVVARAEAGGLTVTCAPTDVSPTIARMVEASAPFAWKAGRVEIVADIAPNLPPAIVDVGRLEQILSNLLRNATRHTPPGGIIAVLVAAEPAMLRIEVRDTGEGIAAAELPHIWERFYRASNARDKIGAGLGLTLVKELTEAMGGAVSVQSVVGEGSRFIVRLPRA